MLHLKHITGCMVEVADIEGCYNIKKYRLYSLYIDQIYNILTIH